jgi:hypothetical protein
MATGALGNSLASPGFAPIASLATQKADAARDQFIDDLKHGGH